MRSLDQKRRVSRLRGRTWFLTADLEAVGEWGQASFQTVATSPAQAQQNCRRGKVVRSKS